MDQRTLNIQNMELINESTHLVCKSAVNVFGNTNQIDKAKEELSELLLELNRLQSSPVRTSTSNIITEIADVIIMMQQLAIIFGENKVVNEINNKISRLENLIVDYDSANHRD